MEKIQKSIKQVLPKSKKTKTSFLNAPTLTKEQQHIKRQTERLTLKALKVGVRVKGSQKCKHEFA